MSDPMPPPDEEQRLDPDDDTLPPEHPAGADATVSGGEVLSGEGLGTGAPGQARRTAAEPDREAIPGDDA